MRRMPGRAARTAAKTPSKAKAPASKSPALKANPKKAAKKASVKAGAKKAPLKKAPLKKATKAPAKPSTKQAPLGKPLPKKVPAKKALMDKAPIKQARAKKSPGTQAAKPEKVKAKPAPASTPARDARTTLAAKRAITEALTPHHNDSAAVDAYFRDVDHPFKAEMEAVRAIILGVSPKLSERIKWNAPSFFYKEDLGAFNPRASEYAHLILLFPGGGGMDDDDSGLLEGHHKDRREVKFHGMDDVQTKKPILEKIIVNWLALRDG
jgi:hypothetical protein